MIWIKLAIDFQVALSAQRLGPIQKFLAYLITAGGEAPTLVPLLERLTKSNYEFGRLAAAYDEVNRHIWRIESEDEPTSDEVLEKLRKRRLLLKDDIAALLAKEQRRM